MNRVEDARLLTGRGVFVDRAENPHFVETLAKRGYRFIAPVRTTEPQPATLTAPPVSSVGVPNWCSYLAASFPGLGFRFR